VTINCAERGLLLLRVRDEIHMTVAAYQTLYESSIAFGMRKALIAEQRKAEMQVGDSPLLYYLFSFVF
jgi:dynein light intermediate chain, axonemal